MIRQFISAASLIALVACGQGADKADHGVSTDPNAATGFITSNTVAPETATVREGETIARDADGRPYSYALLGEPLPALSGQMADGTAFDPASLDGTWNVIDVWGIWCGDCMADAPYVAALVTAIEKVFAVLVTFHSTPLSPDHLEILPPLHLERSACFPSSLEARPRLAAPPPCALPP